MPTTRQGLLRDTDPGRHQANRSTSVNFLLHLCANNTVITHDGNHHRALYTRSPGARDVSELITCSYLGSKCGAWAPSAAKLYGKAEELTQVSERIAYGLGPLARRNGSATACRGTICILTHHRSPTVMGCYLQGWCAPKSRERTVQLR